MKKLLIGIGLLIVVAVVAVHQRHWIFTYVLSDGAPPELLTDIVDIPGANWHGDYFAVVKLDENTYAIGEPRYYQQNYSYLILGSSRAVLFDAGPGFSDIRPIVASLTDLPVTFIPSHFHYDHIGNKITFDHVAVVDLPHVREQAQGNSLHLNWQQHLGAFEGIEAPVLNVDEWLKPGSDILLGGRTLKILYTPGHTDDSISLLDEENQYLFSGDFIYTGDLYAFVPNSSLQDYLNAARTVLEQVPQNSRLYGAHDGFGTGVPVLGLEDVSALQKTLLAVRAGELSGEGLYPVVYVVNARVSLLAEPKWLQNWHARYPAGFPLDAK